MAQLDCSVDNCIYNKEECCCKGDIMVGGKHADKKDDTSCEHVDIKGCGACDCRETACATFKER